MICRSVLICSLVAAALQLQKEPTEIVGLVNEVLRSMQSEAGRGSISMNVVAPTANIVVDVDPVRIREVLTNLLSNAIRHTPAGNAVTTAVSKANGKASVTVADTGEGMPPQEVARIFDRFYKGASSRGSGLGLSIAKGIVAAHGGDIDASSEAGRGTTVTFTLPTSEAD